MKALKWRHLNTRPWDGRLYTASFSGVEVSVYVSVHASDRGRIDLRYKGHTASTNWEGGIKQGKALDESLAAWWVENKPMAPAKSPTKRPTK